MVPAGDVEPGPAAALFLRDSRARPTTPAPAAPRAAVLCCANSARNWSGFISQPPGGHALREDLLHRGGQAALVVDGAAALDDRAAAAEPDRAHDLRGLRPAAPRAAAGVDAQGGRDAVGRGLVGDAVEQRRAPGVGGVDRDGYRGQLRDVDPATEGEVHRPWKVRVTSETPRAPALNAVPKLEPFATTM